MTIMTKLYFIEKRAREGDFAVRKANSQQASAVAPTQAEAIALAHKMNEGAALVAERVRHTSADAQPNKWRKVNK